MNIYEKDVSYMKLALEEAALAAEIDEVPVGAILVRDGQIIGRGHNMVEALKASDAHAEMIALREAERKCSAKWLLGATMYVTLEPCSMCAGAMVLARIERLVIGASDPKTGACGSTIDVIGNTSLNHSIEVNRGILEEECSEILRSFFRRRRRKTPQEHGQSTVALEAAEGTQTVIAAEANR